MFKTEFLNRIPTENLKLFNYDLVPNKFLYNEKITIRCLVHNFTWNQIAASHIQGQGCKFCKGDKIRNCKFKDIEYFKIKSNKKHNNFYDYSKTIYNGMHEDVTIICPVHGEFRQNAGRHSDGSGCQLCKSQKMRDRRLSIMDTCQLINKFNLIHKDRYNYDEVFYINAKTPVKIKCKKHGYFYQLPFVHLNGNGCSKCKNSKGEFIIQNVLDNHVIEYISQKIFPECRYKLPLKFDFYLPDYNLCIEYDGEGHFAPIKYKGTTYDTHQADMKFEESKIRDSIKTEFCNTNSINLLRIPYWEKDNIEDILIKILYSSNEFYDQ